MKRFLVLAVLIGVAFPAAVRAQAYYNGGYYNAGAYGVAGYAKPQPAYTPAQSVAGNQGNSSLQNYFPAAITTHRRRRSPEKSVKSVRFRSVRIMFWAMLRMKRLILLLIQP